MTLRRREDRALGPKDRCDSSSNRVPCLLTRLSASQGATLHPLFRSMFRHQACKISHANLAADGQCVHVCVRERERERGRECIATKSRMHSQTSQLCAAALTQECGGSAGPLSRAA